MYKYLVIVAVLICFSPSASANFWRACNETIRTVDHIETPLCDNERCFIRRGDNFYANITISSPYVHHELMSQCFVFIFGIGIELPMEYPHDNGCNALYRDNVRVGCPTVPHLPHVWRVDQPIDPRTPTFQNSLVRYLIWDRGSLEGCVEFWATVTD